MKTQDGGPVQRDANFLAETRTMMRDFADRHVAAPCGLMDSQRTCCPPGDLAVTIYSEAFAKGSYNSTAHNTTAPYGPSPFGKMTNFSKCMSDFTKDASHE